jgi:arylsulfatase A
MKIIKKPFLLTALLCATGLNAAEPAKPAQTKPNFIVILTDDQGWGTTSVVMDPQVPDSKSDFFQTPNIERLAAAGMRFTQGYASHCNCSPSRAALQTGRSPAALHMTDIVERSSGPGYEGNRLIPPHHISALPANARTIPLVLKAKFPEYRSAHFGKWHLGSAPKDFGYDKSDGPTANKEGGEKGNLPDDPKKVFSITRKAVDFLKEQTKAGHPFYLQVSHYAVHAPNQSRPKTTAQFKDLPKGTRHNNVEYGAMQFDMDESVGLLLDAVKDAGIADNTYIIFTSDNGAQPSDDPENINGPVRGYKASVWEGGIRVPFLVAGPGVKAGSLSRIPVVGSDILPTICDLAGISTLPKLVEGGSMKPVLLGEGTAPVKRPADFLVFHWPHYQHQKKSTPDTTIIANGWKLHYWWETDSVQLFHLDQDLGESKDLASAEPERAAAMRKTMTNYLSSVKAQLPLPNPDYKPGSKPSDYAPEKKKGKKGAKKTK